MTEIMLLSENSIKLILIKYARLENVNEEAVFLVNCFSLSKVKTVFIRGKWSKSHLQKENREIKLVWYFQHYPGVPRAIETCSMWQTCISMVKV